MVLNGVPQKLKNGTFKVSGVSKSETRRAVFVHKKLKLAGRAEFAYNSKDTTVQLKPWGEVKGRFVDKIGDPIANQKILSIPRSEERDEGELLHQIFFTDSDGRFHIVGLVPDRIYRLRGDNYKPQVKVVVEPGQVIDLGDVTSTEN